MAPPSADVPRRIPPSLRAPTSLVAVDAPFRHALAEAMVAIAAEEQAIAEAEMANETLRCQLTDFQRRYETALAPERRRLVRITMLLRHLSRLVEQLTTADEPGFDHAARKAMAHATQRRRQQDLLAWRAQAAAGESAAIAAHAERAAAEAAAKAPSWHARHCEDQQQLKDAYRTLARRYHPDLAPDEAVRSRRSQMMAYVNELYANGERERLTSLAEQAQVAQAAEAEAEDLQVALPQRLADARDRLAWFAAVRQSLQQEHDALLSSPTAELCEALEGGPRGTGLRPWLLRDLRAQLQQQAQQRLADVPRAIRALEEAVHEDNRRQAQKKLRRRGRGPASLAAGGAGATGQLVRATFDPHVGQTGMRLGLEDLALRRVPQQIVRWGERLAARAETEPAFVRLMLLTYVVQLAPGHMPGLETYDQLAERYAACNRGHGRQAAAATLDEALLLADGLVEYAPERTAGGQQRCRLRFRDANLLAVIPQALRDFAVRALFADLLGYLGEAMPCPGPRCRKRRVFAVPLFALRGLDNVRALSCPSCGHVLRQYVLAKGDDVHGVLNQAYLDFEKVHEWTVAFGPTTLGVQFLPQQAARLVTRDLRLHLHGQLFARNELPVPARALVLSADGAALGDADALSDLPANQLRLQLSRHSPLSEGEALARLRYLVQTRFAPRH